MERREVPRQRTIYRPAYIKTSDHLYFAVMRNVSVDGARFTGDFDVREGDLVEYGVGGDEPRRAKVIWREGPDFGVANVARAKDIASEPYRPYRSVRLPISAEVLVFVRNTQICAQLQNISQSGACIKICCELSPGELVTLQLPDLTLGAVSVKWRQHDSVGLRFANSLGQEAITRAVEGLQRRAGTRSTSTLLMAA